MHFTLSLRAAALACLALGASSAQLDDFNQGGFSSADIIHKDVLIIGGGSSGTYAATKLLDAGKSVLVIEKEAVTGGHTNTYHDLSGVAVDYGVVVYHNNDLVKNYFQRFNITLSNTNFAASNVTSVFADFTTGKKVTNYVPEDPSSALVAYYNILQKYPYLEKGFDLPGPVPEEILLPFGVFMQRHNLTGVGQFIHSFAQGLGNVLDQPTIYVFKNFGTEIITDLAIGFLASADNSAVYRASAAELTTSSSLLLNSTVVHSTRSEKGVQAIVCTPTGYKVVLAKQLLITSPPKAQLQAAFDLNTNETSLFRQFNNSAYYTGLIRGSHIPAGKAIINARPDTPYFLPKLPGLYSLRPTAIPDLIDIKFGSPFELSDVAVKNNVAAVVQALGASGVAAGANSSFEWIDFSAHNPFELTVSVDAIRKGFYRELYALQGGRSTWWTGASWHTQDSSMVWEFTEGIVDRMLAAI